MANEPMRKGSTPTLTFTFPDVIDLTLAYKIWLTFTDNTKEANILFERTLQDNEIEVTATTLTTTLTQQDTLSCPKEVCVMANSLFRDGDTIRRVPSEEVALRFTRNLKPEVLE